MRISMIERFEWNNHVYGTRVLELILGERELELLCVVRLSIYVEELDERLLNLDFLLRF